MPSSYGRFKKMFCKDKKKTVKKTKKIVMLIPLPAERPKTGSSAKSAFFMVFLPHMASNIG